MLGAMHHRQSHPRQLTERPDATERRLPRSGRVLVPVALASLALVAAGCGEDEEQEAAEREAAAAEAAQEEYQAEAREAIGPVAGRSEDLIEEVSEARSVREFTAPLRETEDTLERAAEQLEELDPPEEVQNLHNRLVTEHEEVAKAAESAREAAEDGEAAGLEEFRRATDRYTERTGQLAREFAELGYEL